MYEKREQYFVEDLTKSMRETICDCSEASFFTGRTEKALERMRYNNMGPKWYKYYNGRVGYRIPDMVQWIKDVERQRCAAMKEECTEEKIRKVLEEAYSRFMKNYSEKIFPLPHISNRRAYSVNVQTVQWVNM